MYMSEYCEKALSFFVNNLIAKLIERQENSTHEGKQFQSWAVRRVFFLNIQVLIKSLETTVESIQEIYNPKWVIVRKTFLHTIFL